jgi:5-methylthioadenosine/S-adenosylhomocysteine deaminase
MVLTMDARRTTWRRATVAVAGQRIAAVGPDVQLRQRFPGAAVLDAGGCLVTPGFVNAHQHATGDPLVRSTIPDDLGSQEAIFGWAVPLHAHHGPDDDELSATVAAVESLECGVTTVVEAGTVAHPDRVVAGLRAAGVRGTVGAWGWDVDDAPYARPAAEVLARLDDLCRRYPPGGDVVAWVTLVGHDLASDDLLAGAADLARAHGTGLTLHVSPGPGDAAAHLARVGVRPLVHWDRLGVLGRHTLLGHAVHLDDEEVDLVVGSGTAIAFCPWAYLRLAQGAGPHGCLPAVLAAGGRVALGADSHNAGDRADVLDAARLTAGLYKDAREDTAAVGAHRALELATIDGAEAIGMGEVIGSLEPGKRADLVVHALARTEWLPVGDPVLQLVWAAGSRTVRDVLVAGRRVVAGGRCTTVDHAALRTAAAEARTALLTRAGITPPTAWPVVEVDGGAPRGPPSTATWPPSTPTIPTPWRRPSPTTS